MQIHNSIYGALVADAAALGLHWLYDSDHIAALAEHADIAFRSPDKAVFENRRGSFVHWGKRSGDLSHYGESVRIVAEIAINDSYSPALHRERFYNTFGPCGSFHGYADKPTKQLIARMIKDGDDIAEPSGMDDNQMPAFCVLPGLFSINAARAEVLEAAKVISVNQDVLDGVGIAYDCLSLLQAGESLAVSLQQSADAAKSRMGELLRESLSLSAYDPVAVSDQFGKACYVDHAMPVAWHLLFHADNFESAVRDNIRCAGDSCGRGLLLGAIAGLNFGVPPRMGEKLSRGVLPAKH